MGLSILLFSIIIFLFAQRILKKRTSILAGLDGNITLWSPPTWCWASQMKHLCLGFILHTHTCPTPPFSFLSIFDKFFPLWPYPSFPISSLTTYHKVQNPEGCIAEIRRCQGSDDDDDWGDLKSPIIKNLLITPLKIITFNLFWQMQLKGIVMIGLRTKFNLPNISRVHLLPAKCDMPMNRNRYHFSVHGDDHWTKGASILHGVVKEYYFRWPFKHMIKPMPFMSKASIRGRVKNVFFFQKGPLLFFPCGRIDYRICADKIIIRARGRDCGKTGHCFLLDYYSNQKFELCELKATPWWCLKSDMKFLFRLLFLLS